MIAQKRTKRAYLWFNAGTCYVLTYPRQKCVCKSRHWRRATRRARNLGYAVRVYKSYTVKAPRDAIDVSYNGYVLPATTS